MKRLSLMAAVFGLICLPAASRAADFQQRWAYTTFNCATEAETQQFILFLKQCRECGVTHVTLMDLVFNHIDQNGPHGWTRLEEIPPAYPNNVKRVRDEARRDNITLVPRLSGASGGMWALFEGNGNLMAGIPARNIPFIVNAGVGAADPDAVPKIPNAGFNDVKEGKPVGWTVPPEAEGCFSADTAIKHGDSGASVKLSNFEKLTPTKRSGYPSRHVFFSHVFEGIKPFQYYRLSFWMKTDKCKNKGGNFTDITSSDGMRRNTFQDFRNVPATSDWKHYEITLNSFEVPDGKLKLGLGVGDVESGTVWFDDVKLEPAGLLLIVRGQTKPLVVTSEDGAVTYREGEDFAPVADPVVSKKPFGNELTLDHPAPALVLTKDSRIKEGQRLLVSFYHPACINTHQYVLSIQDPAVLELIEREIESVVKAWPTGHYLLPEDELRLSGWEAQPEGQKLKPGQLLAKLSKAEYDLIQKYSPHATAYVWSDMYNPYHNARSFDTNTFEGAGYYYLCNGNYDNSIAGLPKDVVIAMWWTPSHDNRGPKFFADRGYRQIVCGYYDTQTEARMKINISHWMEESKGLPGVIGIMYTTWQKSYAAMPGFFKLAKQYPNFVATGEDSSFGR